MNKKLSIYNSYFFLLNRIQLLVKNQNCICCAKKTGLICVCQDCQKLYLASYRETQDRCKICGKVLISETDICFECRENKVIENVDSVFPIYSYKLWKKDLLFNWKIDGQRKLVSFFAKQVFCVYEKNFSTLPIVPIPPRPNKIKKNGWDQIHDLATFLKIFYDVPILNLLKRTELTQQKKLNRKERLMHKGHSYVFRSQKKAIPEEVVLIDDILTTGVTIETCAEILKKNGVKKVHAITLFIAD